MLTNINLYDMNTDSSKTVVNSAYKDFAPHFTPMEQFLLSYQIVIENLAAMNRMLFTLSILKICRKY